MLNNQPKVRVENLSKIFGDAPEAALEKLGQGATKDQIHEDTGSIVAVSDVSFTAGQGEIFVVMGLSGSGKSTLIRCVNRLIEPTAGAIHIDGEDVCEASPERLREIRLTKISMVFQHFALFPHKTVAENVEFGLKVRGVDPEERRRKALRALDMVGLKPWADNAPDNLSGGMQQRVGLARGLAVDPDILLMDEPFSALDPLIRREMQEELLQLQRQLGMTIIFITHDLHEALILGSQIAIMKDGAFVQVGTPEEIVAHPADPYVVAFTQDVDRGRVLTAQRVMRPAACLPERRDITVEDAKARVEEEDCPALYLVDDEQRPVAMALAADLGGAPEPLATSVRRTFPQVRDSTTLHEMFDQCMSGLPVAVTDSAGRLVGLVRPLDVFGELGGGEKDMATGSSEKLSVAADTGGAHG
jgi:glycine betaine/proline transport system ATP-binding protein